MAKETAEQKLLKIIESTEAKESAGSQPAAQGGDPQALQVADSVKGVGVATIRIPPFLEKLILLIKGQTAQDKTQPGFGLRETNRVLICVIIVVAVVFMMDFVKGLRYSKQEISFKVNQKTVQRSALEFPFFLEASDYLAAVSRRNIFQPYEEVVQETAEEMVPEDIKMISQMTKDLKLVGVSWLDTPESASALIENTTSGMTYFLRTGERVNNVNVKQIYADSVVLSYDGEELELSL